VDPEFAELTSAAAIAATKLLVTDGWEAVKNALVSLWRRVHPDRADRVGADLIQAREDLLAEGQADTESLQQAIAAEWQGRLRSLLTADPELSGELRRILDCEFRPALDGAGGNVTQDVTMHAHVEGGGSVFQAGRDQHISGPGTAR
jgi:hypothetical protein